MSAKGMNLTLIVWRQSGPEVKGAFKTYEAKDISPDMSFLEMIDVVNEGLIARKEEPIAFDHDCREGICGSCGCVVDGKAHGPQKATTLCQLHMRQFSDGQTIVMEPFRAKAFPIVRDLVVDRSALDKIIQAGGFVSVGAGSAPDANSTPIPKRDADRAMDMAACIGCGACVATCPNAAAMLFVGAKVAHLSLLPQGRVERSERVLSMVNKMEALDFGTCSNHYECELVCPKEIKVGAVNTLNREYLRAKLFGG